MISRRASCLRLLWRQEGRQLFEVGRSFGRAVPATGWERAASRAPREPDARGAAHETVWLPPGVDAGSWTSAVAGFAVPAVRSTHGEGDAPLAHSARCASALLRFFFLLVGLPPQHHQRGVGHQRERHIAVPGMPGAHFILIESHLPFGLFVALFDLEAPAGHTHQLGKRRLGWTRSPKVGLACS